MLGLYAVWFELSWGWNYARAPLESRVRFDPSRITPAGAAALRQRAMAEMNALAPSAHARAEVPLDREALRAAWLPAVQRSGDTWTPQVGPAKPTIFNPFMLATGTSGFINPLTLNVALASDLLWFERPFRLAHEWSHDAAYRPRRRGELSRDRHLLALATIRRCSTPAGSSSFSISRRNGITPKHEFVPLVWQDFAALRRRDARHINVMLAHWTWRTYNVVFEEQSDRFGHRQLRRSDALDARRSARSRRPAASQVSGKKRRPLVFDGAYLLSSGV